MTNTTSDTRIVICHECGKTWRYGCSECADQYADYHHNTFNHYVAVVPQQDDIKPRRTIRRQRHFWET